MSLNNCCSSNEDSPCVNVNVEVDVPKIVKYACIAGVLIVGIVFGSICFQKMMEEGLFSIEK